jgi:hypothetical protein
LCREFHSQCHYSAPKYELSCGLNFFGVSLSSRIILLPSMLAVDVLLTSETTAIEAGNYCPSISVFNEVPWNILIHHFNVYAFSLLLRCGLYFLGLQFHSWYS